MTNKERSVDEIVEELFVYILDLVFKKGKNWYFQDCLNVKEKITQTLKAERQRREEILNAKKISIRQSDGGVHTIILDEGEEILALTQPNNPK